MIRPASEQQLCEVIKSTHVPFRIVGGGTRWIGQTKSAETLCTGALSGVKIYEPGALTLVVGAGTLLGDVTALLEKENQILAFEPPDWSALLGHKGASTIGGVVAANASGSRRVQAGACRDSLIGVRFVDGTGRVIKNGGRVMKNVTGYDLVKLMAGARGVLGVLSEVAFKVLPRPAACLTLRITDLATSDAVRAMSAAMASPYHITGAAHCAYGPSPQTFLRVEGFADQATYKARALARTLDAYGAVEILDTPEENDAIWKGIRDVSDFVKCPGNLWRIMVKPSDAPAVIDAFPGAKALLDWAGGLVWLAVEQGGDIRSALGNLEGHATLMRQEKTSLSLQTFAPEALSLAKISAGLRAKFDPRRVLNPGLMG